MQPPDPTETSGNREPDDGVGSDQGVADTLGNSTLARHL